MKDLSRQRQPSEAKQSARPKQTVRTNRGRRKPSRKQAKLPWVSLFTALIIFAVWFIVEIENPGLRGAIQTGTVVVHYIDVGQGDSMLIQTSGGNMLIDTGEHEYIDKVSSYLREQGVSRIDRLVATHPHSDHIGGMAAIIRTFDIGTVIMPRAESTGLAYERMLEAMSEREMKAHVPTAGESFSLGDAKFTVLAPNSADYENLNNFSIVLRMTFGNHSFMFTGDAEGLSEREMLRSRRELSSDFLKVGHHGSRTSTEESFLAEVEPKIAVITVGMGNSYGHPHPSVVERLEEYDVEIYRTDRDGNIMVESDGRNYKITTQK